MIVWVMPLPPLSVALHSERDGSAAEVGLLIVALKGRRRCSRGTGGQVAPSL